MGSMETTAPTTHPGAPTPTIVVYRWADDANGEIVSTVVFESRPEAIAYAEQGLTDAADMLGLDRLHPDQCNPNHQYDDATHAWTRSTWNYSTDPDHGSDWAEVAIAAEPFEFGRTYGSWDAEPALTEVRS